MSRKRSFEDSLKRKMNELPVPDENESWQKMKQLLDDNKKRKPFVLFKKEKITGATMLLLFLCLWLMISPEKMKHGSMADPLKRQVSEKEKNQKEKTNEVATGNRLSEKKADKKNTDSNHLSSAMQVPTDKETASVQPYNISDKNKLTTSHKKQFDVRKKPSFIATSSRKNFFNADHFKPNDYDIKKRRHNFSSQNSVTLQDKTFILGSSTETIADIDKDNNFFSFADDNSSRKMPVINDSLQKASAITTTKTMISIKKRKAYFIEAGIGLQQQIPLNGQMIVSYQYNGDHTLVQDYIPSVYMKLVKENRWFIQAGFSYASPRLIKEFTYWQNTKTDYSHANTISDIYRLKKTFYSEVPVSFHFYVTPSWTIGGGIMYGWLRGAVAGRETVTYNALSGKQTTETQLLFVKAFTDSFLYKTQAGLLLQTGYEKNGWSVGLRYVKDMQPFVSYTLPDGRKNNKRNASLDLMIRYRLFQSKKFNLYK